MTPAARIAAAIEILADFTAVSEPVERRVDRWFRTRRFAGSRDRRAVRELVFSAARRWGSAAYAVDSLEPRLVVAASLMLAGDHDLASLQALFGADRYGPPPLLAHEIEQLAHVRERMSAAPLAVRCNYPAWLEPELLAAFGDDIEAEMAALMDRAPLDLRVNAARATRQQVVQSLAAEQIVAEPTPLSPVGLRCPTQAPVTRTAAFTDGLVEIQDEGSQIVARLVGAGPGERIVDYCAGAGGKTLAMAADMAGSGCILAFDLSAARLKPLSERAARAGVTNVEARWLGDAATAGALAALSGGADRVLVDAPCSGSGTWRRSPGGRWILTPDRLEAYRAAQATVMREAALLVRPGGRLVYATCSILPSENDRQVQSFLEEHGAFTIMKYDMVWRASFRQPLPAGMRETATGLLLTPHATGTDGFFVAVLERTAEQT